MQDNNATATVLVRHTKKKEAAIIEVHTRFTSFSVDSTSAKETLKDELNEAVNWDSCNKTAHQDFNTKYPKQAEAMQSFASTTQRHDTEGVWEFVSVKYLTHVHML